MEWDSAGESDSEEVRLCHWGPSINQHHFPVIGNLTTMMFMINLNLSLPRLRLHLFFSVEFNRQTFPSSTPLSFAQDQLTGSLRPEVVEST
jgi:hypothetical protein